MGSFDEVYQRHLAQLRSGEIEDEADAIMHAPKIASEDFDRFPSHMQDALQDAIAADGRREEWIALGISLGKALISATT